MGVAALGDSIYYFGGIGAGGTGSVVDVSNDLWRFDTDSLSWQEVPFSEPWPSPRRGPGLTAHDDGLLLWGGSGVCEDPGGELRPTYLNDLWRLVPSEDRWELLRDTDEHLEMPPEDGQEQNYPGPRYTHAFRPVGDRLFLFSGHVQDRLGNRRLCDAWACEDSAWRQIPSGTPEGYTGAAKWPGPRYGCMHAGDDRFVYVCGGFSDDGGDRIDLWRFDTQPERWELLCPDDAVPAPHPRYCAAFALQGTKLLLFGGRVLGSPQLLLFNDLWSFDLGAGKWEMLHDNRDAGPQYPATRGKSAAAVVDDYWYILGGGGRHGHLSDFWRYSFAQDEWQMISAARPDDPCFR